MNPTLKSDLQLFPFEGELFHVYDPATSRHFKMGRQEVSWLRLLDGTRSVAELSQSIPQEHFDDFLSQLGRLSLLSDTAKKHRFNPLKIQWRLLHPNDWLNRVSAGAVLYRQLLTVFSLPLIAVNVLLLLLQWPLLQAAIARIRFSLASVIAYLITILVIGLVHEFSHALVAKSRGANVPSIGVMLFYLQPAFFADISGISLLSNRAHRIDALLAGVRANNLLITIAFFGFFLTRGLHVADYFAMAILLNALLSLFNLIPFVEYDGYYVLLELFGEPQFGLNARRALREKAFRKVEYVAYFILSQIFTLSLVFSAVLLLRGFALRFTRSAAVNYVCLLLMLTAYVGVSIRTARRT